MSIAGDRERVASRIGRREKRSRRRGATPAVPYSASPSCGVACATSPLTTSSRKMSESPVRSPRRSAAMKRPSGRDRRDLAPAAELEDAAPRLCAGRARRCRSRCRSAGSSVREQRAVTSDVRRRVDVALVDDERLGHGAELRGQRVELRALVPARVHLEQDAAVRAGTARRPARRTGSAAAARRRAPARRRAAACRVRRSRRAACRRRRRTRAATPAASRAAPADPPSLPSLVRRSVVPAVRIVAKR